MRLVGHARATPDALTPAIGFRTWRIETQAEADGWLVSPFYATCWPRSERLEAACRTKPASPMQHRLWRRPQPAPECSAPAIGCGCGIYAYHDVQTMLGAIDQHMVGGAILCWGRLLIHPEGIRAEFARPLALSLPAHVETRGWSRPVVMQVAEAYGVPALAPPYLAMYASEFGDFYWPLAMNPQDAVDRAQPSALRRLLTRLIQV
jgi:hypothetical protein